MPTRKSNIFFHTGPNGDGANMTGIGDAMRDLHNAGIPVFLKSVDNYGPIYELDKTIDQSVTVNHVLVFRISDKSEYTYDTPRYHDMPDDPEGAADLHWRMTKTRIPPEFNKSRVWLELTNEVDRNKCEWLGRFAIRISDLAETEGYKVLLFGWASGEPEPIGWEEPSMLRFLQTCANKPDQRGVSLHEYSYIVDDILHQFPFKLGRFQYLFATCDKHGINRPTTAITEWGWTLDNVPSPELAIPDVEIGARLYAPYSNILGAAIWYLGPGFGSIGNKAQKLIAPVTSWTKATNIEYNPDPEIIPLEPIGSWIQHSDGENDMATEKHGAHIPFLAPLVNKRLVIQERKWNPSTQGFDLIKQHDEIAISNEATIVFAHITGETTQSPTETAVIENGSIGVDISHWNT